MRWSSWLGACVIWACAPHAPRDGAGCRTASDCRAPRVVRECLDAERDDSPTTPDACERAWNETRDEEAAAAGAYHALKSRDEATLKRWVERAPHTPQGARILHYWGEAL